MQLTCPKCQGTMRQYERSGVNVDQCTECRGIFLDRGELERLVDGEASWHAAPPAPQPYPERGYQEREGYRQQPYQQSSHGHGGYPRKKKKGFLEELFD